MAMENGGPGFEDIFPIKNGDIPASYVSLPEGSLVEDGCFFLFEIGIVFFGRYFFWTVDPCTRS